MPEEDLSELAAQLSELERQRGELVAWILAEGHQPTDRVVFPEAEKQARWSSYPAVLQEIESLRNRYTAASLRSMAESSERLQRTSLRLEAFTVALLILTGVLAVVGTDSYILQAEIALGLTGREALFWATAGIFLIVALILFAFWRLRKSYGLR